MFDNIIDNPSKMTSDLCAFLQKHKEHKCLVYISVLSGCDYVPNLRGIGLKQQ